MARSKRRSVIEKQKRSQTKKMVERRSLRFCCDKLKITSMLDSLPSNSRNDVLRGRWPGFRFVYKDVPRRDQGIMELHREYSIETATVEVEFPGGSKENVSCYELLRDYLGLLESVKIACSKARTQKDYETLMKMLRVLYEFSNKYIMLAQNYMCFYTSLAAIVASDPKEANYICRIDEEEYVGIHSPIKVIYERRPEDQRSFVIDGVSRKAESFKVSLRDLYLEDLTINGKHVGRDGHLPVYIQSHAWRRVYERVTIATRQKFALFMSIFSPTVVTREDGTYLLEYSLGGHKIGYFTATIVDECFVITSFLLLTMQGTPEAEMLYRNLKLTRSAIQWNGLDKLETFLTSDIFDDPELSDILIKSGCESLRAIRHAVDTNGSVGTQLVADDLKNFLGMGGTHRHHQGSVTSSKESKLE
jgi:hypothetical protein